jgi:hypothetical protein
MGAQLVLVLARDAGLCERSEREAHRGEAIEHLSKRSGWLLIADRLETVRDTLQVGPILG